MPRTPEGLQRAALLYPHLEKRQKLLGSLKGLAELYVKGQSRAAEQVILIKRPDRLRLDTLNPAGETYLQIVLVGDHLQILWPQQGDRLTGDAARSFLSDRLHLALPPRVALPLLLGIPPLEESAAYVALEQQAGFWLIGKHSSLAVDPQTHLIRSFEQRDQAGRLLYSIKYGDYQIVDGIAFPHQIQIFMVKPRAKLEIRYEQIQLNHKIPERVFMKP